MPFRLVSLIIFDIFGAKLLASPCNKTIPHLYDTFGIHVCTYREFNGADMDQGLLLHHFVINEGNSLLIDTETKLARYFKKGLLHEQDKVLTTQNSLSCCMGILPTQAFAHFTGRSKPWMLDSEKFRNARKGGSLETWINHLDSLNLPINSSNILEMGLGSPLGFFNAGFPKGGFKKLNHK